MNNLYLFSFIPVIGLSIAMMLGIHNKSEYGNRWKYLTLSIIFLIALSILSIITIGNPSIDSKIENQTNTIQHTLVKMREKLSISTLDEPEAVVDAFKKAVVDQTANLISKITDVQKASIYNYITASL